MGTPTKKRKQMNTSKLKFASKDIEKKYKSDWERDHKMVRGKFSYLDCPGGTLTFPYHKYPDDEPSNWELQDGQIYDLPYMVAKHLATDVFYQVHKYELDEHGRKSTRIGKKLHRTNFQKLDFEDAEFSPSKIVTVEKVEPVLF